MTDRGVSTVVSYVLVLAIVAILSSALIGGFAPLVTNQQQSATHSTLKVFGNDLAGDIESADRLAQGVGADGAVVLRVRLPDRVGGSPYEIAIRQPSPPETVYEIVLRPEEFDTSATVVVRTQTQVQEQTGDDALDGGSLRIVYEDPELVIENA